MSYTVSVLPRAVRELRRLPTPVYERVRRALHLLAENPRPPGCLRLTGRQAWRIRAGDYRIIYEIDDARHTVTVVDIGHRGDIYR